MNKIMKKSIISLMTISSCLGSTTLLASAKEDNNEINPQTINITGNTVNYETYGEKECSYDFYLKIPNLVRNTRFTWKCRILMKYK